MEAKVVIIHAEYVSHAKFWIVEAYIQDIITVGQKLINSRGNYFEVIGFPFSMKMLNKGNMWISLRGISTIHDGEIMEMLTTTQ